MSEADEVFAEQVARWRDDPRARTNLRILSTGDDGRGWRMSGMRHTTFAKAPDDSFVGEDDA